MLDDLLDSVSHPPSPEKSPEKEKENESSGSIFGDIPIGQRPRARSKPSSEDYAACQSMPEILITGWIPFFARADSKITWLDIEREFLIPLDSHTILVGRIDAHGLTADGEKFFGEWKTSKPPWKTKKEAWKKTWRMRAQSLTYGLAAETLWPETRRFTVRQAYKSNPPEFDYEWFSYTTEEIEWWRGEILKTADEIRWRRGQGQSGVPWSPNLNHCFKYGQDYVCPFYHEGCAKLNWTNIAIAGTEPRVSHLQVEREIAQKSKGTFGQAMDKKLVVLDATRADLWSQCRERYRREYELEGGRSETDKEALNVGGEFHDLAGAYYKRLMKK